MCMLVTAMVNPGIITLVYPFAVFGYAIFEETRPPKWFWHFILMYTQVILITEFLLSLNFWKDANFDFHKDLQQWLAKYYTGLYVTEGTHLGLLFVHFLPKILVMLSVINYI